MRLLGWLCLVASCANVSVETDRGSIFEHGDAHVAATFGQVPDVPEGPLDDEVIRALDTLTDGGLEAGVWGRETSRALESLARARDPRVAWPLVDLLRFVSDHVILRELSATVGRILGLDLGSFDRFRRATDHLLAWDVPAPPGYLSWKRAMFLRVEPAWNRLMVPGAVDWRWVTWGGVRIDDRPFGETDQPCDCIPAADLPVTTSGAEATWLDDDDVVFGIVVGDEARAYPRRIMEVREMVNDVLGGRSLAIPYCTLCASAQAWLTGLGNDESIRLVWRTSGLLSRSNKLSYDLESGSVFDTFTGRALTGPLYELGIHLEAVGVVTTSFGAWRRDHPETTVLAEELALGRDFDFRRGRDADGPIFPVGDVDPRLPVQADVLGAVTQSGRPIAFPIDHARAALLAGEEIRVENLVVELDGDGLRAVDADGTDVGSHQAFWFAWSQFHPRTDVWPRR